MNRTFKLKAGNDIGALASKHFNGLEIPIVLVDAGATEQETVSAMLAAAGGSHQNLRNMFIGGGQALAIQKRVKEKAKEIAPKVEAGELSLEEAQQILRDTASEIPEINVRGEGTGTRKPSAKTVEKARNTIVSEAAQKAAALPEAERAAAEALLVKLGLAPAPAAEATEATPATPSAKGKRR